MTDIYSDAEEIQDTGRASFADAPEVQAGGVDDFRRSFHTEADKRQRGAFGKQATEEAVDELPPVSPEHVIETVAENLALRERLEEAEAEVEFAAQNELDRVAYETEDYDSREQYSAAAELLLQSGGEDRLARLSYLLSDWNQYDPEGADAWIEGAQMSLAQGIAQTQNQAIEAAGQEQIAARAKAVTSFWERNRLGDSDKGKLVAAAAVSTPGLLEGTPEQIKQNLEHISATTDEALRAQKAVEFERQQRAPFSEPTFADLKRNRVRQASVVDEDAVQRRMRPVQTAEAKQAERERKIQAFRDEFKQLSKPKFGRGSL